MHDEGRNLCCVCFMINLVSPRAVPQLFSRTFKAHSHTYKQINTPVCVIPSCIKSVCLVVKYAQLSGRKQTQLFSTFAENRKTKIMQDASDGLFLFLL